MSPQLTPAIARGKQHIRLIAVVHLDSSPFRHLRDENDTDSGRNRRQRDAVVHETRADSKGDTMVLVVNTASRCCHIDRSNKDSSEIASLCRSSAQG